MQQPIKAASLWQPWASLIAIGAKQYETRDWTTSYRGLIVIHAAKRMTADQIEFCSSGEVFSKTQCCAGTLPLGCIVAVAYLEQIQRTEELINKLDYIERCFGDFSHGRFAWKLRDVRQVSPAIPYKGRQGLFTISEEEVLHQLASHIAP